MRKILISGASRGIGKSIAEKCLEDGHEISLGVRDLASLNNTKLDQNKNKKVIINEYNAKKINDPNVWINNTRSYFGQIDTLIHCAGIFKNTKLNFKDGEEKHIEDLLNINLMGPWLLTRAAWGDLVKSKKGRIIVLISMSGKRSKSNLAGYTASKFALMGLCQTIRNEGWDYGIRISCICPGWVNTDMAKNVKDINKKEMTHTQDVALIVSNLLKLPNSCIPFEVALNCNLEK